MSNGMMKKNSQIQDSNTGSNINSLSLADQLTVLEEFYSKLNGTKDLDPNFSRLVDEHFWELG
jgi:hypothetical protein